MEKNDVVVLPKNAIAAQPPVHLVYLQPIYPSTWEITLIVSLRIIVSSLLTTTTSALMILSAFLSTTFSAVDALAAACLALCHIFQGMICLRGGLPSHWTIFSWCWLPGYSPVDPNVKWHKLVCTQEVPKFWICDAAMLLLALKFFGGFKCSNSFNVNGHNFYFSIVWIFKYFQKFVYV